MTEIMSERVTSIGLIRYAVEFFAAAVATDKAIGNKHSHQSIAPTPVNYLLGHAMELALKSYLFEKGITAEILKKKFGHSLMRCYEQAVELGFDNLPTDDIDLLRIIDAQYSSKRFEYFELGYAIFPHTLSHTTVAQKLISSILDVIPGAKPLRRQKAARFLK